MVLGKAGAAEVIEQKDASPERIVSEIEKLYENRDKVEIMSESAKGLHLTDTNQRILAVIEKLLNK
jgi:UDP-N-acetylglucosamine--N-acetylmuramyl-(pentapeptide) pyrophosphoryl-undecaprenol N-acetylglucosamine transferase